MQSVSTAGRRTGTATTQRRATPRRYTEAERLEALRVLGECGGNLTRAARRLNLDVSLLWRWRARAAARMTTR